MSLREMQMNEIDGCLQCTLPICDESLNGCLYQITREQPQKRVTPAKFDKEYHREYQRQYRETNREKIRQYKREYMRIWRKSNREHYDKYQEDYRNGEKLLNKISV